MAEGVALSHNVGYPNLYLLQNSWEQVRRSKLVTCCQFYILGSNGMLISTTLKGKVSEIPGTFCWNSVHCCWCELMPKHCWTRPVINPTWSGAKEKGIFSIRSSIHVIYWCNSCLKQVKSPFEKTIMLLAANHAGNHILTWASKERAVTGLRRRLSILSIDR